MCGWPFTHAIPPMKAIAAPVPSPPRYEGLPRYCSEFLVREDMASRSKTPSAAGSAGWRDPQSGFNAARACEHMSPQHPVLYRGEGPLSVPATTLDALHAGEVDVVALDCFWLDLRRRHAPERMAGSRCVATTP